MLTVAHRCRLWERKSTVVPTVVQSSLVVQFVNHDFFPAFTLSTKA